MYSEQNRYIPAEIRRNLRQETCFCCPICGSPILEYQHIIPWSEIQKHYSKHMVALCPTCHALADNKTYSESFLYQLKQAGKDSPGWAHSIRLFSDDFYLQVGSIKFEKPREILKIDNTNVLSINRSDDANLILDTIFQDPYGHELLSVNNNELKIDTSKFWDIEYNGKYLTIRKRPHQVVFNIVHSDFIWLKKGIYHFGTSKVEFMENGFSVNTGKTFFNSVNEKVIFSSGNGISVYSESHKN